MNLYKLQFQANQIFGFGVCVGQSNGRLACALWIRVEAKVNRAFPQDLVHHLGRQGR